MLQFTQILSGLMAFAGALFATGLAAKPVTHTWTVDGVQREALVFAPAAGADDARAPLVFAFHGHGGSMHRAAQGMRFQQLWPQAIVVYMQGVPTPNKIDPQGLRSGWQILPDQEKDRDLKFFDAVLTTLHEKYPVDDRRIYATGFSNGASFDYLLLATRGKIFAAFAPCAGRLTPELKLRERRPVLHTAGENDRVVPFAAAQQAIQTVRRHNGCAEQSEPWGSGCTLYPSTQNAPVVTFIHPGGHAVPAEAPELIVKFFKAHALESADARSDSRTQSESPGGEVSDPSERHVQSDEAKAFRKTAVSVSFRSHGLTLHGWIYKPPGEGPFPAIIWNHGSERRPTAHPELAKFYTSHGFVVFLPVRHGHGNSPGEYIQDALENYRGQVHDLKLVQRKAVELQELYNRDVVAALTWLKAQPFVDPNRIAVSGVSYGGIQTLLAAEHDAGVRAFIPFAPGAMSWANPELRQREIKAVERAQAPLFLLQAKNDYNIGPSEVLGPLIRNRGGINQARLYPPFGTTHPEGHGGFACWEAGIAIWGADVLSFLNAAGMSRPAAQ